MSSHRPGKVIVTGVAGFIGSHLAERLADLGYPVLGVDCFTDYYPRPIKEANLARLRGLPGVRLLEDDILDLGWPGLLEGTCFLFHQAAQTGVRGSWGDSFQPYVHNNILATQRLLEAVKENPGLETFVFASSSSIYGDAESYPTAEDVAPRPVSPYGVTKLACEHLCRVYEQQYGVPVVMLRYFTAYGPRQRPDMAFHRFIQAMLQDKEITVYGNGEQTRDFTYVDDVIQANILAMNPALRGKVYNVGGGSRITVNRVIHTLEGITGHKARLRYIEKQKGDAGHTMADITLAQRELGYRPTVTLEQGLQKETEWLAQSLLRL